MSALKTACNAALHPQKTNNPNNQKAVFPLPKGKTKQRSQTDISDP
jgi:hypothetical protein